MNDDDDDDDDRRARSNTPKHVSLNVSCAGEFPGWLPSTSDVAVLGLRAPEMSEIGVIRRPLHPESDCNIKSEFPRMGQGTGLGLLPRAEPGTLRHTPVIVEPSDQFAIPKPKTTIEEGTGPGPDKDHGVGKSEKGPRAQSSAVPSTVSSSTMVVSSSMFSAATLPSTIPTSALSTSTVAPALGESAHLLEVPMPLRRHTEGEDKFEKKEFRDVGCQTTISLPTRVSAMWQCHCPEANTIVDRIAKEPRLQPASPRVLLDSFAVDEIDWSDKEAIDKMERDERDIREAEFLGEVSAYDPRQPDATAPSPNTPGSRNSMFDFDDLDQAESEEEKSEEENSDVEDAKRVCQVDVQNQIGCIETSIIDSVSRQVSNQPADEARAETQQVATSTLDRPLDVAGDDEGFAKVGPRGRPIKSRTIGSRRFKMARGITVDSGAHDNVMPKKLIRGKFNKGTVRPSAASRAGVHYVACNNGRIPNEGEFDFKFHTEEKASMSWTFQIAEVNKALAAVSALVDSRHRVIFDQDDETGADCSFIIDKSTGHSTKMRRERNVWVVDAYVDEDLDLDFARQE